MSIESVDKIVTQCGACAGRMRVPAQAVGKKIRCPKCAEPFVVAEVGAAGPKPVAVQSAAVAPAASAALKKVRPAAARPATPPPPAPAAEEPSNDDDLFAELARQSGEASAEPIRMPAMQLPTAAERSAKPARKREKSEARESGGGLFASLALSGGGQLALACALSCVGAAIGGGIWFAIAKGVGAEYGIFGALTGLLSGIGMSLVLSGGSPVGGIVAVAFSVLSFTITRFLIIQSVVLSALTGADGAGAFVFVTTMRAGELVAESGKDPEKMSDLEHQVFFKKAEAEVKAMSKAEIAAKAEEYREVMDELGGSDEFASLVEDKDIWNIFFRTMRRGAIFGLILAVSVAFRVGYNGIPGVHT